MNLYTYRARNNTAVIQSSVARHVDGNHYLLGNIFDGSVYANTQGTHSMRDAMWMGECFSYEPATITVTFDYPKDISYIAVSVKNMGSAADGWSWYAIDAYEDALDPVKAVHVTQMIDTDDDHGGQFRAHAVKGKYKVLVFYVWKRSYHCSMNEIEIFVASKPKSKHAA